MTFNNSGVGQVEKYSLLIDYSTGNLKTSGWPLAIDLFDKIEVWEPSGPGEVA